MSLARGFSWSYQDWNFTGYSLAGITTSIYCRNASVCFDVGQGLPFQNAAKHILISHGHMDHASGLPYLVAQKTMAGQKSSNIYVPPSLVNPLEKIFQAWQEIDGHSYEFSLSAAEPGKLYGLDRQYSFRAIPSYHRVESQGYVLYRKKKRLKAGYQGMTREEILAAKEKGESLEEEILEPAVAYSGDTKIEFLESPEVREAKILFLEATFWDQGKPVEEARRWGHIHFDEVLEALPALRCEKIVLIHASIRYTTAELSRILEEKVPPGDRQRFEIFPRPL